jgi:enoyl-CoA hydratase
LHWPAWEVIPIVEESRREASLRVDRPVTGVLRLALHRPARRNALDRPLLEALLDAFDHPAEPVVVLGSTSTEAFCAGADLRLEDAERAEVSDLLYALYERMTASPAIVVAALPGPAVGGGAQLAIAADLRVAGRGARIQVAGPGHGLAVAAWGLPTLVGRSRALDLCLTGRRIDAQDALAIGLVDRVEDDPGSAAVALAAEFAALDEAAVARVKAIVARFGDPAAALAEEAAGNHGWTGTLPPR